MKNYILITFLFSIAICGYSQYDDKLVQFSGVVKSETGLSLPYVHIIILNNNRGTVTDINGMFSFVTNPNDTILFSSVGFKRQIFTIPDTVEGKFVDKIITLQTDTILIEEVMILPWKTYEEFKQAFIELRVEDKDMENAQRNIALLQKHISMYADDYVSPQINFNHYMQQKNTENMYRGMQPSTPLLNPLAWARFIESVKNGDLKDENKEARKKNKIRKKKEKIK